MTHVLFLYTVDIEDVSIPMLVRLCFFPLTEIKIVRYTLNNLNDSR